MKLKKVYGRFLESIKGCVVILNKDFMFIIKVIVDYCVKCFMYIICIFIECLLRNDEE